jgi:cytochrome c553
MNKRYALILLSTFLLFGLSNLVLATPSNETVVAMKLIPNIEEGKKIYALCASCHEENGWGKEDGAFPVIAGQHRSVIIKQLADIRARNRDNPTMFPFSGDDVIGGVQGLEDVAEYISQLPQNTQVGQGDGAQLEKGKKIFKQMCSGCHGDKGQGNAELFFPRLQGQHYAYMLRQLQWMRDGRRKNANPAMLAIIKDMDDETLGVIADYISRIIIVKEK